MAVVQLFGLLLLTVATLHVHETHEHRPFFFSRNIYATMPDVFLMLLQGLFLLPIPLDECMMNSV